MKRIDVSGDGNCMLHSIALAYLWQVVEDETPLEERFKKLFGDDQIFNLKKVKEDLAKIGKHPDNPNSDSSFACISNNEDWKALIQKFRQRLVEHMKMDGKSEYYSSVFSNHTESQNAESYDEHLQIIRTDNCYLGDLEARAASDFLQYPIQSDQWLYNDNFPDTPVRLYHVHGNHYNFGLAVEDVSHSSGEERSTKINLFRSGSMGSSKASPTGPSGVNGSPSESRSTTITYSSSERGKPSYRGFVYQLKLLILFVTRAIDRKYDFRLATEMDAAEKFDDLVFKYYDEDKKKWFWRYLQIKHKENKDEKKITDKCLTSEKGDKNKDAFTLHKYFISFCRITYNKLFKPKNSNELIDLKYFDVCTNTDFDSQLLKDWRSFLLDDVLENDDILNLGQGEIIRKFKHDPKTIEGIVEKIKPGFINKVLEWEEFEKKTILNVIQWSERINIFLENQRIINAGTQLKKSFMGWLLEAEKFEPLDQAMKELIDIKKSVVARGYISKIQEEDDVITINSKKANVIEEYNKIKKEVIDISKTKDAISKSVPRKLELAKEIIEKLLRDVSEVDDEKEKIGELRKIDRNDFITDEILKNYTKKARTSLSKNLTADKVIEELEKAILEIETEKVILDEGELKTKVAQFLEKFRFVVHYPGVDKLEVLIKTEFKNVGLGMERFSVNSDLIYSSFENKMSDWFKSYEKGCGEFLSAHEGAKFLKSIQNKINLLMIAGITNANLEKFTDYGIRFKEKARTLTHFLSPESKLTGKQILHISTQSTLLSTIKVLQSLDCFDKNEKNDNFIFMGLGQDTQKYAIDAFSSDQTYNLLVIECRSKSQGEASKIKQLYEKLSIALSFQEKKVILVAQDEEILVKEFQKSHQNKYEKENDCTSFVDLNEDSQDKVLEKEVNLQGRTVKLNELIDKNSASDIDQASLSRLIEGENIQIGNEKAFSSRGYVSDYNIDRTLRCKNHTDEHYAITETDFSELIPLKQELVILSNHPGVGKSTVLTSIARKMRKFADNKKDGSEIIWIVRVNLNDCAVDKEKIQSLHNINFEVYEIKKAIEFIAGMVVPDDPKDTDIELQRKLFKAGLEKPKGACAQNLKIVILIDGFDEISPSYKLQTTKLIKALQKSMVHQLWVTTRVDEEHHLKEELKSPVYTLNPLTHTDQKKFLSSFWRWSLKFSKDLHKQEIRQKTYKETRNHLEESWKNIEQLLVNETSIKCLGDQIFAILQLYEGQATEQLESLNKTIDETDKNGNCKLDFSAYANLLLDQFSQINQSSISETKKGFTNIPLNLMMLAEVVFEMKFKLPANLRLGLPNLYDIFIKIKFNIFCKEKATGSDNLAVKFALEGLLRYSRIVHQILALKIFFSKEYMLPDFDELNRFKRFYGEEVLLKVGLLTLRGGQLEFIHRSFAEYFLSEYLMDNLKNERVQQLLMEEVLLKKSYALIRTFFNGQLKGKPLPEITLSKTVKESIAEGLEKIYYRDTVLHLIAREGHTAIITFLLERYNEFPSIADGLVVRGDQDGNTPLHEAASMGNSETIEVLLKWVKENLGDDTFQVLVLKDNNFGHTALHIAAENSNSEPLEVLLECVKKHGAETCKKLVARTDILGQTALHWAAWNNRSKTLKALLEWVNLNFVGEVKNLVLKGDIDGDTALHFAVLRNNNEETSLSVGASIGNIKTVEVLLDWVNVNLGKETLEELVLKGDNNEETVLYAAASRDNSETFHALLEWLNVNLGKETLEKLVLKCDNDGETVLYAAAAASRDNSETLEGLMDWVKVNLGKETLEKLVLKGDNDGETVLHAAASRDNSETLEVLLDWVNVNLGKETLEELVLKCDNNEGTVLYAAASRDNSETFHAVLELLNVNLGKETLEELVLKGDNDGETVLYAAASRDNSETLEVLIDWVNVNLGKKTLEKLVLKRNKNGETVLCAATSRDNSIEKLVLKRDNNGETSLSVAASIDNTETIEVLLD